MRRGLITAIAAIAFAGCGDDEPHTAATIPQPSPAVMDAAGLGDLPVAPAGKRVDLTMPTFTHPTRVTNPLFPIARLPSAVLGGRVDGKAFRAETTVLPDTRVVEWPEGRFVETLISQYVAYVDGRLEEVALDFYAQADDGSVWYFGEDVFNYADGRIEDTDGTWLAGRDGPAAMIMPAHPKVGDVYRPESIPGLVFEEVTVKRVGATVTGPDGPVRGAMIAGELHQDGSREDKTFAPGYGEYFTASGGDVEAFERKIADPPATDRARFRRHARTLVADARAGDLAGVLAELATLERIQDRFAHTLDPVQRTRLDSQLLDLRAAVSERDLRTTARLLR